MITAQRKQRKIPEPRQNLSKVNDFIPCSKCDGHAACEDFGCAIELGLGRMVKKNIQAGYDDWD